MSYLLRHKPDGKPGPSGLASESLIRLAASAIPQVGILAAYLQAPDVLNGGIDFLPPSPPPVTPLTQGVLLARPTETKLLDYLALVGRRPLIVLPSGNIAPSLGAFDPATGQPVSASSPGVYWCAEIGAPLFNGLVVGASVFGNEDLAVCAAQKPASSPNAVEGNPTGRFTKEYELPHAWAPGANLTFDPTEGQAVPSMPFNGTSYSALVTSALAATTIQAARPSRIPHEGLRAVLVASGGRILDHGADDPHQCGDSDHKLGTQTHAARAAEIVRHAAPRGTSPVRSGFDTTTLYAADFSACRLLPRPRRAGIRTFCALPAPGWLVAPSPPAGPGESARVRAALMWDAQVTFSSFLCRRDPLLPQRCVPDFSGADVPAPDLDLSIKSVASSSMMEGTWEALDVAATVDAAQQLNVGMWWSNKYPVNKVYVGVAWSSRLDPVP